MFVLACISLLAATVSAAPGYLEDFHSGAHLFSAPALLPAPTLVKAPVYAPAPIYTHAPVLSHAPLLPAPTIIKTAAPVVKAIAPATSYATVTQVHVTHPQIVKIAQPIVKTVVAPQPIIAQPVLKSYALPAPALSYGHGWMDYH